MNDSGRPGILSQAHPLLERRQGSVPLDWSNQKLDFRQLNAEFSRLGEAATITADKLDALRVALQNQPIKPDKLYIRDDDLVDGMTAAQLEREIMKATADEVANDAALFRIVGDQIDSISPAEVLDFSVSLKVGESVTSADLEKVREQIEDHMRYMRDDDDFRTITVRVPSGIEITAQLPGRDR